MSAWIGLGSNIGNGPVTLWEAMRHIAASPGVRLLRVSPLYETQPWGDSRQPNFTNAVVEIDTDLSPRRLLAQLQHIEGKLGRERDGRKWGPRTIDLDLLLYDDLALESARLTVPHPRAHERAFVLAPIAELAPRLEIPGRGVVSDLLSSLDTSTVRRLDTRDSRDEAGQVMPQEAEK